MPSVERDLMRLMGLLHRFLSVFSPGLTPVEVANSTFPALESAVFFSVLPVPLDSLDLVPCFELVRAGGTICLRVGTCPVLSLLQCRRGWPASKPVGVAPELSADTTPPPERWVMSLDSSTSSNLLFVRLVKLAERFVKPVAMLALLSFLIIELAEARKRCSPRLPLMPG